MLALLTVFNSWVFLETRKLIPVFPEHVRKLWHDWELRVLVLVSLTLQLCLLHFGSRRRYSVKTWLRVFLWLSYLGADSVATVALGVISQNQGNSCNCNDSQLQNELTAFWAPFLLLHLGGQDTITAYAVQDTELWLRHLLGLVVQTGVALYIFLLSWKVSWLSFLTIPMFLAGFIKYAERTWVLKSANSDRIPASKLIDTRGEINPDLFLGNSHRDQVASLVKLMKKKKVASPVKSDTGEILVPYPFLLFQIFRCLFRNQKVSWLNRNLEDSENSSNLGNSQSAWKTIEDELGYVYDVYYTKAPLFFTTWGFLFRFFSFTSILFVFVLFLIIERHKYPQTDLIITYLLLVGAILIEIYAVILLCASDWPWPQDEHIWLIQHIRKLFDPIRNRCAKLTSKQRWSNSMGQLDLLGLCPKDKSLQVRHGTPKLFVNLREWALNQMLPKLNGKEMLFYRTNKPVSAELKDFVFNTFQEKLSHNSDGFSEEYDEYITHGFVIVETYQSIIIWHIATALCFYTDSGTSEPNLSREVSKDVSDYMMYILAMCPLVLSTGNTKLSLETTCTSVKEFFQRREFSRLSKAQVCSRLIEEYTDLRYPPHYYLLDDILLPLAVKVAIELNQKDGKWEILSKFWVENLAYVAILCQGNYHAQLLRKGGEFLTHVWLLIEHFDLKESFRKSWKGLGGSATGSESESGYGQGSDNRSAAVSGAYAS